MRKRSDIRLSAVLGILAPLVVFGWQSPAAEPSTQTSRPIQFNRDIRPVFSDTCFKCHGFDENKRKKGLRLDVAEGAFKPLKGGGVPFVPGKPDESEAYLRIISDDPDQVMPPADSGLKITAAQKQLIKQWIEQGAQYQVHWAFVPPVRPQVPEVKKADWVRNPIDAFVLANLEQQGLLPSPEADRPTLIRRLSLDLIGLPPTSAEVDAFVSDSSPDAYERVVDRLLSSPHYGERMAMQWLDGARYADSHGYQADWERYQWPWRDWVINAFNSNQPFDQFTIDQIAGDLRPNATPEQKMGTGFCRNHRINTEGGIIPEEWRVETVIDRVETMSTMWLGLTMGCCRCHDHKYDPFTQKDFYQLFSYFNNCNENGTGAEKAGNHPPIMRVTSREREKELAELARKVDDASRRVKAEEARARQSIAEWEKSAELKAGVEWTTTEPTALSAASRNKLTRQPDGSILVSGTAKATDTYTLTIKPGNLVGLKNPVTAIRVEAMTDPSLPAGGPGRGPNGNFVMTGLDITAAGKPVTLAKASADFSQDGYPVDSLLRKPVKSGWAIVPKVNQSHVAIFSFDKPVTVDANAQWVIKLEFKSSFAEHAIGRLRLSLTDSPLPHESGVAPSLIAALKTPVAERTDKQRDEILAYYRSHQPGPLADADRDLLKAQAARDAFEKMLPTVMVMEELPKPRDAFILIRGQYDKRGEKVVAAIPAVIGKLPAGAPDNRLGLAQWLVDPANPLTARVAVNRFWEKFFGVGLVKSTENFGSQAEWPSHPELLDWLATEFVRTGWDMKAIQKTIVMSATYRQSAAADPALYARDPENRLLARGARFRVQAEVVRDQALYIAGLLNDRIGGPSVRPYQPQGVWDETNVYGNLRNYKHDTDGNEYRRSLYTIWKRTAAPPDMQLFDMPSREICTVRRSRTNTPLQALALLNEDTFVEAARRLAENMIREGGATASDRITYAFKRATARTPTPDELRVLTAGLERRLAKFKTKIDAAKSLEVIGDSKPAADLDPGELAAYTTTASVILNLDETITRQ